MRHLKSKNEKSLKTRVKIEMFLEVGKCGFLGKCVFSESEKVVKNIEIPQKGPLDLEM